MKIIAKYKAGMTVAIDDRDVLSAIFLSKNPAWHPEDLGYPKGDYILFDLLKVLTL